MLKRLSKSLFIFFIGIILPEVLTYWYNNTYNNDFLATLQYITGFIILFCSVWLFVINIKEIKMSSGSEKLVRIFFVIMSVSMFLYISFALLLQLVFRNGIGL
jgi:hypothetical protein